MNGSPLPCLGGYSGAEEQWEKKLLISGGLGGGGSGGDGSGQKRKREEERNPDVEPCMRVMERFYDFF